MTNLGRTGIVVLAWVGAWAIGGCGQDKPAPTEVKIHWETERVGTIEGFDVPECVLIHPDRDVVYVSNMETSPGVYWNADGKGFLSLLEAQGLMKKRRWQDSTPQMPLHEPKGMCVVDGVLYVADITRVMTYPLAGGAPKPIDIRGAKELNDMVAHDGFAYVSDTANGTIHKLGLPMTTLKAPASVNGLTFDANGRMFAASWDQHDVFEVDPTGQADPKPFGLAKHFTTLDGIEVLGDGTFVVSDLKGGKICAISPDRKTVTLLAKVSSPADIGLDRRRMLLYVPTAEDNKVVLFRLRRR